MSIISHAQNYEDVLLYRALRDVEHGFYIDVGAWFPDTDSVTRAFSDLGWRGINVDPMPAAHAELARRRPNDLNLMVAVGERAGKAEFFDIEGTGLSTLDPAFAQAHEKSGFRVHRRVADVVTLADICDRHAPPVIHFLKLDCEGGERSALAGADFDRHRPWIILAEAVDPVTREPNHADWEPLLLAAGYRFVWFDGLNRFYVAAEHEARLGPLLALPPNVFDGFVRAAEMPLATASLVSDDPLIAATPPELSVEERIELAARCRDCDDVPKAPGAGEIQTEPDGVRVQIMHNGLKVLADGYCGEWMTRLIRLCRGHHEPQEERLFHEVNKVLPRDGRMIELGGNWSYYSAWFLHGAPDRRAVVLEPDPQNGAVGKKNLELNGLKASFVAASAGAATTPPAPFLTERSGILDLPCYSVPDLMRMHGMEHLELLHCDTQGFEFKVLEGCRELFHERRIDFVFVSTHVHQISGDPLTHQRCLHLLRECGAVIEAEHDAYESFSGDGLIVARFGRAPEGWRVTPISVARRSESLFRDPCFDLAAWRGEAEASRVRAEKAVTGVFETLLFRGIDRGSLDRIAGQLRESGDISELLRMVLLSAEFATKRRQFGAAYLHETQGVNAKRLPALPADGAFSCASLTLTLDRDGALGRKGDPLAMPNDLVILPTVLAAGAWNYEHIEFIGARLDRARTYILLDIGANVGLFSLQVLNAFDNIAEGHCIEPDPSNYAALRANLSARRLGKIECHPIALGAGDGPTLFYRDSENSGNYSLHPDAMRDRPSTEIKVEVKNAAEWFSQHLTGDGPILWKSDTQGSDEAIVAAAPWPLWKRVEIAIIELWRIRKTDDALQGFLDKIGDMPNRQLGGKSVTVAEIADYVSGDDWAHDDLYLWR